MAIFKSKTTTKDGRRWYYSTYYLSANGERKRKKSQKYATKHEAQDGERLFLAKSSNSVKEISFEEACNKYMEYTDESVKGSTKYGKSNRYRKHILPYFGSMNIHEITVSNVIAWKSEINNGSYNKGQNKYSLPYKQTLMIELRSVLNYGMSFYGLKENVARKVLNFVDKNEAVISDEEKIRYITPAEFNLFISTIEKIVFKVFFAFLYYMGVRRGEAQALTWEDVMWDTSQVRIIKTITNNTYELDEYGCRFKITNTKNRKNRTLRVPAVLQNMLLELHKHYLEFEGFNDKWYVFGGYRYLSSQSIDREKDSCFDLVRRKYGTPINRITNHEFRHSHASYLISRGVKVELIAKRLGDTVAVVLKTYAHLYPDVEDEIIEKLDQIEDHTAKI